MTEEQKVAFINSQASAALIEAMGMVADNQARLANGLSIAYDSRAFDNVIERYGLGANSVLTFFRG